MFPYSHRDTPHWPEFLRSATGAQKSARTWRSPEYSLPSEEGIVETQGNFFSHRLARPPPDPDWAGALILGTSAHSSTIHPSEAFGALGILTAKSYFIRLCTAGAHSPFRVLPSNSERFQIPTHTHGYTKHRLFRERASPTPSESDGRRANR